MHEEWMARRKAAGWRYGPEKDERLKTHPCLVPYSELDARQRQKDVLFLAIVSALSDFQAR